MEVARRRCRGRNPEHPGKTLPEASRVHLRPVAQLSGLAENSRPPRMERFRDDNRRRARSSGDFGDQQQILAVESREDLVKRLEEAYDLEQFELAKERVRQRVGPHTWEAFRLVALDCRPAVEVASRTHMQIAMVYLAKSKVLKMLRQEIEKLEIKM